MTTSTRRRAGPREWAGLGVLALPTVLLGLDVTVMYLAIPALSADLNPSSVEALWIMDAYGFLIAGLLITMGTLGDRIGRRRLLMIGAVAFGAASVAAAFSTSATMLIASRAALGIAGATLMPSTLALISNMFTDVRQRALAFGVWATMFALGMAAGPLIGGLLLDSFWWGSAFLVALPVVALVLVAAPLLLPEYRDPGSGRIDLISVGLSLAAILPVIYAIKHGASEGVDATAVVGLVAGLAFGVAFVRRQNRLPDPLLDLRLFAAPAFTSALTILLVGLVGVGGAMFLVTQHLQLVEQLPPMQAGFWMGPPALMMFVAAIGAPLLARRIRPGHIVGGTLALSAVGYVLLRSVDGPGSIGLVTAGFGLVYLGLGAIAALGTDLVVGGAPPEKAGSASAMSETVQELGLAVGVAVLGSLASAVYRDRLVAPAELPAPVAAAYGESLSGASSVADRLPAGLIEQARAAQVAGLQVTATVSAVAILALAVLSVVVLRHIGTVGDDETRGETEDADEQAGAAVDAGRATGSG
ncbi:MFS transporter [Pseudonocardia sp. HH130630-07]|uniref:MFS transporter n=1 Tax=Pseudonocardia sp. HH130630-07 TaxID=1690815 RepID=UPI000814EF56|nr:MFS transporter [Pseudonocardia sp. HH130630-07]ANY07756.1 MFS transporter [Pseudonocardia sp. HH130630-07]